MTGERLATEAVTVGEGVDRMEGRKEQGKGTKTEGNISKIDVRAQERKGSET